MFLDSRRQDKRIIVQLFSEIPQPKKPAIIPCLTSHGHVMAWAVTGFLPQCPGFSYIADHVGFVVDKVEMGEVFLQVCQFSPANYHSTESFILSFIIIGQHERFVAAVPRDSVLPRPTNIK
jgi:hypothetical protein